MSLLPLVPRNRCGGLRTPPVGPRADRHFWSGETNRFICLFNRAYPSGHRPAEVGLETRLRSDPRRICLFSGTVRSKPDRDRLDKRGGLGSPQRFFRPLLGVQKWARGPGAEPPKKGWRCYAPAPFFSRHRRPEYRRCWRSLAALRLRALSSPTTTSSSRARVRPV